VAGFPRGRRVRRDAEIRAIVGSGRRLEGATLRVHVRLETGAGPARATVVVPRFGRTAVERNRLRRRLREIVRLHLLDAPELAGAALVVKARAGAYGRRFAEFRAGRLDLAVRLSRLRAGQR
jgi:ribonuclease P protein component